MAHPLVKTMLVSAVMLAATVSGCPEPAAPEVVERAKVEAMTSPPAAPEVMFTGCEVVLADQVCLMRPQATLSLWAAVHRDTPLVLELDGQPLDARWVAVEDGLRTTLSPGERHGRLTLRDAEADWQFVITVRAEVGLPPALQAIERRSIAGEHAAAARALEAELPRLAGIERALALGLRGDNEYRRLDLTAMQRAYDVAFEAALAEGLLRSASVIALTTAFVCDDMLDDLACTRHWLARHEALIDALPEARIRHAYYAGLLADREGDLRTALRDFEQSARDARALGLDTDLGAALLKLGAVHSRLGDGRRAEVALVELLGLGDRLSLEHRARALMSAGWVALEARARGEAAEDPAPRFAEALAIVGPGGLAPDPYVAAEIRINMAYGKLLADDPAAARQVLSEAEPPSRRLQREQVWMAGQIELAAGRFEPALRRFEALATAAAAAGDRWLEWHAAVGAGEALEGLGRAAQALARYRRAAEMHSLRLATLAFGGGRDRFAAEGDRGARRLVHLLLRLGRVEEAACAARLARTQAFAGLAAAVRGQRPLAAYRTARDKLDVEIEATWTRPARIAQQERARLAVEARRLEAALDASLMGHAPGDMSEATGQARCDALREPGAGELLLIYYPLERGTAGFALDEAGVVGVELAAEGSTPEARGGQLLGPFAAQIDRAARIRVIASGAANAEALHALPWRGRPLVEQVPVVHALDLPRADGPPGRPRHAVQLAPPSNLAGATDELEAAAAALRARGIAVTRLGGDEPDLRSRLGADLLHYVGHARADSWDSALELGGERRVTTGDLLSVAAPRLAVLSGCETGLPDPGAHAGGMSLAHALLLAGTSAVIATDAEVDDRLASAMVPAIVAALADGVEPGEALRRAQREHAGQADWIRFRAFVP